MANFKYKKAQFTQKANFTITELISSLTKGKEKKISDDAKSFIEFLRETKNADQNDEKLLHFSNMANDLSLDNANVIVAALKEYTHALENNKMISTQEKDYIATLQNQLNEIKTKSDEFETIKQEIANLRKKKLTDEDQKKLSELEKTLAAKELEIKNTTLNSLYVFFKDNDVTTRLYGINHVVKDPNKKDDGVKNKGDKAGNPQDSNGTDGDTNAAGLFFDEEIDDTIPPPPLPKPASGFKPLFNTREQKETVKYKSAETRKGVIEEKRTEANGINVTSAVKKAMGNLVAKPVTPQNIDAIRTTLKKDNAKITDEDRKEELEQSLKDIETHDKKRRLTNNPVLKARNISDVHEFFEASVRVEMSSVQLQKITTTGANALKDIKNDSPVAVVNIGPAEKTETLLKVINTKALIINGDALLDTKEGVEPTLLQKTAPAALKALGAMSEALSKTTIDRRFPHIHVCNLQTGEKKNADPDNAKHAQMLIKSSLYAFAKGMTPILGASEQACINNYYKKTKDAKAQYLIEALEKVNFDPKKATDEQIIAAHEHFAKNFLDEEHQELYNEAAEKADLRSKNDRPELKRERSHSGSSADPASPTVQPVPPVGAASPSGSASSSAAASGNDDAKYKKYVQMKKLNLPDGAIKQKMGMDGLSKAEQDAFFSSANPSIPSSELPRASGPGPGR